MIIAHRGGVALSGIRENTIQAFERAMMMYPKIHGIECDLRLTADGVVVIHHDSDCQTIDGRKLLIETAQWNELPDYVPTLQDLLRCGVRNNYKGLINLEIKTYNTIEKVLDILAHGSVSPLQILLSSFLHTEILRLRDRGYMRGIIIACQPQCSCFAQLMAKADKLIIRDCVIDWKDPKINNYLVHLAPDVYVWTVNNPVRSKYLTSKGFNVISDVLPQ